MDVLATILSEKLLAQHSFQRSELNLEIDGVRGRGKQQ